LTMTTKAERAQNREKYCNDKLTPILQDMVAEMLKVLPEDPDEYMRTWLDSKISEEGCPIDYTPQPIVVSSAPPPVAVAEIRPSVGTPLEFKGQIVPEEEATRLSTLTQLIADTPGASRSTMYSLRGSVVPVTDKVEIERLSLQPALAVAAAAPEPRVSTLSQAIADTPGAARTTVVTIRGTIVPEADVATRLSTFSQVVADTPGAAPRGTVVTIRATVTEEEAKRLSTMSQIISDTPGAARGTVHSQAPMVVARGTVVNDEIIAPGVSAAPPPLAADEPVTVLGTIVPEAQLIAEQNRLSTLTQMLNDTPGAARGTLLTVRGSVIPSNATAQEGHRNSTLSATIAATPGAVRGTVVTVRGTLGSKNEVVVAQVVVPHEEAERLSTLSQAIADTPGAARATTVTVRGTVVTPAEASRLSTMSQLLADTPGAARGTIASVLSGVGGSSKGAALVPLDKDEEARRSQQKRASNASSAEQLRAISEIQHAEHETKLERESGRKSAVDGMEAQQAALVKEHGEQMRKVASLPKVDELQKKLSQAGISESGAKAEALVPLDKEEEARRSQQKRASNASNIEQLRAISEIQHAEHESKLERESGRKSAVDGMDAEQSSLVQEHGEQVRKVPSLRRADELQKELSQAGISAG